MEDLSKLNKKELIEEVRWHRRMAEYGETTATSLAKKCDELGNDVEFQRWIDRACRGVKAFAVYSLMGEENAVEFSMNHAMFRAKVNWEDEFFVWMHVDDLIKNDRLREIIKADMLNKGWSYFEFTEHNVGNALYSTRATFVKKKDYALALRHITEESGWTTGGADWMVVNVIIAFAREQGVHPVELINTICDEWNRRLAEAGVDDD